MIDSRPGKPLQTLLLVDDSPDNLAILAGHLNNDYVISQAASGAEALRLIQTELSPDLILLDVLMPGMDGYEVFRRLAALPCARDIPVIFITALDEAQNGVAAIEMGAVDFVSKPINHVILKARIRNHLQYKALRDELRNQSMMDSLTALANRRRFMEALSAEWFRAVRYSTWLAILFIDIDDFKQYNDRYGHIAGDDCLKAVASAIRQVPKRSHDLVARWGGEEFVCILPDASEAAGKQFDHDNDGTEDMKDTDDDEDGILDIDESSKAWDHDNDGIRDDKDNDDDNDGIKDGDEVKGQEWDHDNDGTDDNEDDDDDNDSVNDEEDEKPNDSDNDGTDDKDEQDEQ